MTFYWSKWLGEVPDGSPLAASSPPAGPSHIVDHFEDATVHRIAEEEALERRGPERLGSSAPRSTRRRFSESNCGERIEHRHVTAELAFERRGLERVNVDRCSWCPRPRFNHTDSSGMFVGTGMRG